MKRILTCFCAVFLLSLSATAREVTNAEAAQAATRWLQLHPQPLATAVAPGAVKETRTVKDAAGVSLFHVVRLEEGGVVVTSAETGITPVIAFLDADDIVESDENPLWRILNADLAARNATVAELRAVPAPMAAGDAVVAAAENALAATESEWDDLLAAAPAAGPDVAPPKSLSSVSDVRVAPLVESKWTQDDWGLGGYVFDYYTPNHYVCGCVATAGAQVMRYWCFPVNSVSAASVACFVDGSGKTLTMKGGTYDWANMPLVSSDCTTEDQRKAIGKLVSDLGIASHMAYDTRAHGGSGAYGTDMAAALRDNFGYASAKAVWLENGAGIRVNIEKHADARNAILASLDANMPVTLSVYGNGGHHIVADGYGYSGNTLYTHINMGWNGNSDAWYSLIAESMTGYNFTKLSEVIYNIHPVFGPGDVISGRVTDSAGTPISGATVTLSAPGMTSLTTKTCPTGIYAFMVASPDTYTITAQSGTASDHQDVKISKIGVSAYMRSRTASGGSIGSYGSVGNRWGVNFELDATAPSLDAPENVQATDGDSAASVDVSWDAVSGATSYAVYRGPSAAAASELVYENVETTQYSDTTATPGVRWFYRVRAFNATGSSDYSDPDSGWRLLSAPATLAATDDSSAAVELLWSASDGATSYKVFRGETANPTEAIATGVTGTSWSDTTAAVGVPYYYRVKAVSSLCESDFSPEAAGTRVEPMDVDLSASDGTSTDHVSVTWNAVDDATSYTLYRGTSASATTVLQSGISETSFNDTQANPGVLYYYRLKAVRNSGTSEYSNADAGWRALAAPSDFAASDGTSATAVNLSWTGSDGAASYTIYRGASEDPTVVLRSGVTGTSWSDTTAIAGTLYHYRVKAVCALGTSAFSASDAGFRQTSMSSVLTAADGLSADAIHVSWTPVSGATGYFLYRSAAAGDTDPVLIEGGLTDTFYDDSNATPGKKYWYKIKAKFASGYSDFSNEDSGYRVLLPPTGLAADDGRSTSNVTIKWNKAVGADTYTVYRGEDKDFTRIASGVEEESYTDTTASPGTVYNYYAVAVCSLCRSDVSEDDTGYRKLSAPTLEATPSQNKVGLSWNEVAGALTYTVYRGTAANSVRTVLQATIPGTGTGTVSFDDISATPEQHYFYKVVAVNGNKTSDDSNVVEGWRTPGFFTEMDASDGTSTERIDVSWTAVDGAVSYQLYRYTRTDAGVMSADVQIGGVLTGTSYSDPDVTPGVLYWYRIKAVYQSGDISGFCKADSGYRQLLPPTGLEATQGTLTTGIKVTWTNTPDGAVAYLIARGETADSTEFVARSTTKLAYTDSGADPGKLLFYRVASVGAASTSEWSVAVSGYRKLVAPSGNLVASDGTSDEFVALSWNVVAGATSYNVYRGGENETVPTTLLCNTQSAEGVWNDATADPGEYYWYRVTAVCTIGDDTICESDFGKADRGYKSLPAPKHLAATDGGEEIEGAWERYFDKIVVSWEAVEGAASYTLYRATSDNPTASWTNLPSGTTRFEDVWANTARTTPITPGTRYWYAVKANYANGTSSTYSNSDPGYASLRAPTDFTAADGLSTANVALSWNAVNGAKFYLVARDVDPVAATNNPTLIKTGQTSVTCNDTTATNGILYYYYAAAVSTGVCTSEWSAVDTGFRMLETPRNVLATDGTSTENVTVSWNPVTGAERYLLFRGEAEAAIDTTTPFREFPADQTEFADVDTDSSVVEPGKPYWYQLAAASSICTGALSAAESGFRAVPGPVTLRATDGDFEDRIEIVWSSVTNASSYSLYRGTSSNKVTTLVATTVATVTNYVDLVDSSIPKPGQIYWYQVRATSTSQTPGAWSNAESGYMTLAAPILSAGQGASAASVGLAWPAVTGASGYNLYRCEVPGHALDAEVTDDLLAGIVTNKAECLLRGRISGTSFSDSGATNGILYAYVLEAYSSAAVTGACSAIVAGWKKVAAPTKTAATDGTSPDEVTITWTGSAGALSYIVLRGDSAATVTNVLGETVETRFVDATAKHGKVYWYAVRAVGKDFTSDPGTADSGYRKFPAPAVTVSDGTWTDRIEVDWEDAEYAAYYIVYRGTSDNPTQQIQYELHGTNFVDTSVTPGTVYYYRLKAVSKDDSGTVSEYGASDSGYRRLEAPLAPTVAVSGTSLRISWTKVLGGTHYRVYRGTSPDAADAEKQPLGNWTTSTTYTDSTCTGGQTYWYFIQAAVNTSGDRPSDIGAGTAGTPPPGNDAFENAYVIEDRSGKAEGGNRGATLQDYEPRHAGASVVAASVWWKWTPAEDGTNVLDTVGSAFDTILAVYTGSSIDSLVAVASDGSEGTSRVVFKATAGTTYYIAVASRSASEADTGAIVLNWHDQSDAAEPVPVDPGDSLTDEDIANGILPVAVEGGNFTVHFRSKQAGVTYQLVAAGSCDLSAEQWLGTADDGNAAPAGDPVVTGPEASEENPALVTLTAQMDGTAQFFKIKATLGQ